MHVLPPYKSIVGSYSCEVGVNILRSRVCHKAYAQTIYMYQYRKNGINQSYQSIK